MFAEVKFKGVLNKFTNFAHGVGEAFELEGGDLWYGIEQEPFAGVGADFAVFAEVLVGTFKFIDCKVAADSLVQGVGPLALLTYPLGVRC